MVADIVPIMLLHIFSLLLWVVVALKGQELPSVVDQSFQSCSQFADLQSSVLRLMDAHFEYAKGLHSVDDRLSSCEKDFTTVKNDFHTLDKKIETYRTAQLMQKKVYNKFEDLVNNTDILHYIMKYMKSFIENEYKNLTVIKYRREAPQFMTFVTNLIDNLREQKKYRLSFDRKLDEMSRQLRKNKNYVKSKELKKLRNLKVKNKNQNEVLPADQNQLLNDKVDYLYNVINKYPGESNEIEDSLIVRDCPAGFVQYMSSCYRFMNRTENWINAEKYCQQQHRYSHLVAVENDMENDFIVNYRKFNEAKWGSYYIWTGGTDMIFEDQWTWVSTQKAIPYTRWRHNDPKSTSKNKCIYMHGEGEIAWDDWDCTAARLNFVCEIMIQHS